jgi:cellulose synthase/poly-beta-1,6-N-acetylglucosamine synthase-like glycosyltransferase
MNMLAVIEIVFFVALFLVVHSYFLYPASLACLSVVSKRYEFSDPGQAPKRKISILISAYNEALTIKERIESLVSIKYPSFEVIIGVDGATDGTAEILQEIKNNKLKVIRYGVNRGKVWVLNDLYEHAEGPILMFTDANTELSSNALEKLERHFNNEKVGGVCGRLELRPDKRAKGSGMESEYWGMESRIKRLEGDQGMTLGANGAIYAIRRELFVPFDTHSRIADDFILPLRIIEKGYYFVHEQDAVAFEYSGNFKAEFTRKVRIGAAILATAKSSLPLMNPLRGFIAYSFWSHKIIRWLVPYLLPIMVILNLILLPYGRVFLFMLIVQGAFYLLAAIGIIGLFSGLQIPVASHIGYFLNANAALVVGLMKSLFKPQDTKWEVSRN